MNFWDKTNISGTSDISFGNFDLRSTVMIQFAIGTVNLRVTNSPRSETFFPS